jgi:hypothetical protein
MPLRSAVAVVDFQQIIVSDKVADRHRLETERLRLATAPGLFPIPLDLNELGRRAINFELRLASSFVSTAGVEHIYLCRHFETAMRHQAGHRRHATGQCRWRRCPALGHLINHSGLEKAAREHARA